MYNIIDAQEALGFLISQVSHIESEVYRIRYPDIQYPLLTPVDTSAPEWAKSVTYFSMDRVGQADWFNHLARDMPVADVNRAKHEVGVEMAGIGYRYSLEELGQAMMIPGTNLSMERADAARRAYEEFVDVRALRGDAAVNWVGLINSPVPTRVDVQADGTGSSAAWGDKDGDKIARDVNDLLSGIHVSTLTVEMADTLLLPVASYNLIATKRMPDGNDKSVLTYLMAHNVYTAQTGQPLTVRAVRGLETAGDGGTGRMIAYRRDPRVLKLHVPMPHRFLPVWQTGPIVFDIPGIFRFAGLDIRLPSAVRYGDAIIEAESD